MYYDDMYYIISVHPNLYRFVDSQQRVIVSNATDIHQQYSN